MNVKNLNFRWPTLKCSAEEKDLKNKLAPELRQLYLKVTQQEHPGSEVREECPSRRSLESPSGSISDSPNSPAAGHFAALR